MSTYFGTSSVIIYWLMCNVTEQLLRNTQYRGFPVVVSHELRFLVGYVSRRDLTVAIGLFVSVLYWWVCYRAMHASAVLLFIPHVLCDKMKEHTADILISHDRVITLVF